MEVILRMRDRLHSRPGAMCPKYAHDFRKIYHFNTHGAYSLRSCSAQVLKPFRYTPAQTMPRRGEHIWECSGVRVPARVQPEQGLVEIEDQRRDLTTSREATVQNKPVEMMLFEGQHFLTIKRLVFPQRHPPSYPSENMEP